MATITKVDELKVWKDAVRLSVDVIKLLEKHKVPYGFKDQVLRSSLSIPSNIAEGYEYQNNKEFLRFLKYARGSAAELKTQLIILQETYIQEFDLIKLMEDVDSIVKQIQGFSSYLKNELNN